MVTSGRARRELTEHPVPHVCCRDAEITGMLWFGGIPAAGTGDTLVDFEELWLAQRLLTLTDRTVPAHLVPGDSCYRVRIKGPDGATTGRLSTRDERMSAWPARDVRWCDAGSLWRGAFLTRGRVRRTGPGVAVDVRCPDLRSAHVLCRLADQVGVPARRHTEWGWLAVTVSGAEHVGSLFTAMGAATATA
ncbi:hypothetical protein AB0A74_01170 [Saccharothrix sp. NPDC042600]|uniref:hypothetical protein n=1 Tax=Saccharothrix TaxID=2071 RepID=UPI003406D4B1|nr:hypothetical protein GCM10017745_49420 [Saccharothrix mutabilis subsp. capreolus]